MSDFFAVSQEMGEVLVNASPSYRRKVLYASGKGPLLYCYAPNQTAEGEIALGESRTFSQPVYLRGDGANVIVDPVRE